MVRPYVRGWYYMGVRVVQITRYSSRSPLSPQGGQQRLSQSQGILLGANLTHGLGFADGLQQLADSRSRRDIQLAHEIVPRQQTRRIHGLRFAIVQRQQPPDGGQVLLPLFCLSGVSLRGQTVCQRQQQYRDRRFSCVPEEAISRPAGDSLVPGE